MSAPVITWAKRLWDSITGGLETVAKPPGETPPKAPARKTSTSNPKFMTSPDGTDYIVVSDQAGYDKLAPGAIYYYATKKQFLTKGR